jgi:two-component system, NtrC family, response regulator AtoC
MPPPANNKPSELVGLETIKETVQPTRSVMQAARGRSAPALELVALGPDDSYLRFGLPPEGSLLIGRGMDAKIDLPDQFVSRQHARLHVAPGGSFELEDLGSVNGVQVGRERLPSGGRLTLQVGEAIFIGRTIAFIQPHGEARGRKLASKDHFATALVEAAAAAMERGARASLMLVEVLDGSRADELLEVAGRELATGDLFVERDGCQYGVLIAGSPDRFAAALQTLGSAVAVGAAELPVDGSDPDDLIDLARRRLDAACLDVDPDQQLIFADPRMRRLYQLARHAAAGLINILILGETGVGKDVLANAIHRFSPRRHAVFQRVECATLAEALAESELFGHARGSFTGAHREKAGLVEAADGGTVFLDEVGELPPRLQAKLLHVLETRRNTRVGAVESKAIDVRFVAATNRDLEAEVRSGLFRKDLFYRLTGFTLSIPPLRDRRVDVVPLARALCRQSARRLGLPGAPALSEEVAAELERYPWPGNVRELRNTIERAVLISGGEIIKREHLLLDGNSPTKEVMGGRGAQAEGATIAGPGRAESGSGGRPSGASAVAGELPPSAPARSLSAPTLPVADGDDDDSREKQRIEAALAACGGNQSRAAKLLGMARSTLVLRLDALGIVRPRKRDS